MRAPTWRLLAWSLCGLSVVLAVAGALLNVVGDPTRRDLDYRPAFFVAFLGFSVVGALIASRQPRTPIGWLLLAQGVCWELSGALAGYANYTLFFRPGRPPGGELAAWALNWLYLPALGAMALLFLLVPDGRLLTRRWRPVGWLAALGLMLVFAANALAPGPMGNAASVPNPFGLEGQESIFRAAKVMGNLAFALAAAASMLSLVFRFRRAGGVERQQLKWLALAAGVVLIAFTVSDVLGTIGLSDVAENIGPPSLLAIPIAMAIAILRYRLYDIDVVVSKTLVFGGLAAFVTAVYLVVVVGIGTAVGRGVGSNLALAVVATALVAVAFQPLRERLQRVVRRLVFGRPTPAEVRAGIAINSLGAFRVVREGRMVSLTAWQSKKARTLLKILVARRGRSTTRDFLMEALWPEENPDVVTRRLSVALTTVRAVLDPEKRHSPDHFVIGDKGAVRLDLANLPIDVEQFLVAAAEGLALYRNGRATEAKTILLAAEGAYDGDFLEEDLYEDWATPLREEARTMYVSVARALAELAEESGNIDNAVRYHFRILEKDSWDEVAHLSLVRTLEHAGRHGEARRYYRAYVLRMKEIGVPVAPFPSSRRA